LDIVDLFLHIHTTALISVHTQFPELRIQAAFYIIIKAFLNKCIAIRTRIDGPPYVDRTRIIGEIESKR
jgi:hypothetical protein